MRVIAGTARSLKLKTPEGLHTRPTTDRIKETLFNMLQFYLADCVFVDLFSGSGGIGIEAISRGAKKAYFVDNDAAAIACIKDNLKTTRFEDKAVVLRQDVISALSHVSEKEVDIIFIDPPYEEEYENKILAALCNLPYVTENTTIIMEAALHTDFSFAEDLGFVAYKEKKYKTNKHVFIKRSDKV